MTEEIFDEEDEGELTFTARPARGKKSADELTSPVENEEPIPLFSNIDKNARNLIKAIRVIRRTPPGDGYKGDVSTTSTLEYIGRRFGDGLYDFEGVNQAGKVLRREQNVKIDLGVPSGVSPKSTPNGDASHAMAQRLLDQQAAQHERDAERARSLADSTMQTTKEQSQLYATMIREDSKTRQERDRDFFKASADQQTTFFQGMFLQMNQLHTQAMEQQRLSFQQTITLLETTHSRSLEQNNPMLLLSLFREGMRLGQENADTSDDPLTTIVKAGTSGLRDIKDMMALQKGMQPAKLPATAKPNVKGEAKEKPLNPTEVRAVIRLKKLATEKGYDFGAMVDLATQQIAQNPPPEPEEDEEEDDDEEGEDEDESEGDDSPAHRPA